MASSEGTSPRDEPEGEPIPLSALQHAVYCLRQAALIHLERLWAENRFTAEGQVLHAVADKGGKRIARGVRRAMALPLASRRLNIAGVADVVEFHPGQDSGEIPFPLEYKRGKPKLHRADEVQLCAQALCLEDMTGTQVPEGALFYAETKRRVVVPFDVELRDLTLETIHALADVFRSGKTPPPTLKRERCRACSLHDLCRPGSGSGGGPMLVLVTYDVRILEGNGAARLRGVAKACRDFGQRVQYSVFEIEVDPAQWAKLKARLESIIKPEHDSLRYYYLGSNWQKKVEHIGAKPVIDLGGTLIV